MRKGFIKNGSQILWRKVYEYNGAGRIQDFVVINLTIHKAPFPSAIIDCFIFNVICKGSVKDIHQFKMRMFVWGIDVVSCVEVDLAIVYCSI